LKTYKYTEQKKKDELIKIFNDPDKKEIINKQLPYWELITGMCIICGIIVHSKEKFNGLDMQSKTWDNFLK